MQHYLKKFVIKFAFFMRIFYIVTLKQNTLECINTPMPISKTSRFKNWNLQMAKLRKEYTNGVGGLGVCRGRVYERERSKSDWKERSESEHEAESIIQ